MHRDEIDWRGGIVAFWSLDQVDLLADLPAQAEAGRLSEDLAQIEYGSLRLVDVGWYPSGSPNGRFRVMVIEAGDGTGIQPADWNRPVFDAEIHRGSELAAILRDAVQVASQNR